jgi:hypothetical protein
VDVRKFRHWTIQLGRWRCALGVALPLAALLCLAGSADAGCGDYVIFNPPGQALVPVAGHLPLSHAGEMLPGKAPCDGPMCRGSRPLDSVPSPPTPQQIDQRPLALLAAISEVECPFLAGAGWPRLDEMPLDGFRQTLLRPPCA